MYSIKRSQPFDRANLLQSATPVTKPASFCALDSSAIVVAAIRETCVMTWVRGGAVQPLKHVLLKPRRLGDGVESVFIVFRHRAPMMLLASAMLASQDSFTRFGFETAARKASLQSGLGVGLETAKYLC
jgi:hypothetical protein